MLHSIIRFSIRNKLIIGLFTLVLICYGTYEVTRLPIDAVPDITNNQVQVITVAPSFGATDIERLVTFPVEQANSNISGLKEIRSFSRFGLSVVTIVFDDGIDIYWARQQVAERLQQIQSQIPQGIGTPELGPITTGLGEIYQYVVRPKKGYEHKYDKTELRTIQDWVVRRQLLGVKGVAEVSSFGGNLKQYEIAVNPNKLQSYGITINDVFTALSNNNQNTGGAYIEKGPRVLFIRSEGLIGTKEDIEQIMIKSLPNNTPLLIRDVADITIGHATRYGALCFNDRGEVSGAIVMMLKGANSNEVIRNIKERIAEIQKTLPEGIVIEPFLDRTKMVSNAIHTVEKNLLEGALIVVFVLVLFLGNFRAGLLVASVIPLAMLFAIIMMNTFGVSGNLMSLGALDFGLIVDGAVIIVEAVMHQLAGNKKFSELTRLTQQDMNREVEHSATKMMNSAVFGQIIILVVYLPIFTLQGIEGKMFRPMAQTVAFALIGAFILSLTYIPMMSSLVLSRNTRHKPTFSDRIMKKAGHIYQHALKKVLGYPKTVLSATLGLFTIALIVLSTLGGEFIPSIEEGDFAVETRILTGSSLNTTIEQTQKAAHLLLSRFPEIEKIVTKIGSSEVPTDPMPMDAADIIIVLKDKSRWTSAGSFNELAAKMGDVIQEIPGLTTSFQYPVQMRFNELMTGARQDVVCKIFGENMDTLATYAKKLGNVVTSIKGATSLYVEAVGGMPQIIIRYNRAAIAQYQLNIADINRVVNAAFAGQSSGLVFEGEKRFDLVVRLQDANRQNLGDVQNLLIPTPQGTQIPLYQLADVSIKDGPNQIQREDARRRIVVGFNVRGRDVESIVKELQEKVDRQIKLPAGYRISYGGSFENLNAAKQRLSIAVPVSLCLIFLLLYFTFSSVRQGLLIYSAIPLSAIGGIFLLALRGMPFSISAGVGFIALFGIAVLNGIVLIAEFNRIKKSGETDVRQIVLKGTDMRLRPVLMTAFVASLGFFPMAVSNGAGAAVQRPLATVVIGGLLIATFLTLFVLPVLYILSEKGFKLTKGRPGKRHLLLLILLPFCFTSSRAQNTITLNAAVDSALKNNLSVRNEHLKAAYQKSLIRTSASLPQTSLYGEYGQINSAYADTRFGVSQNFSFPTVYTRQHAVLSEEWKASLFRANLKEAEIRKNVTIVFYALLYIQEKEKLLKSQDSNYAGFEHVTQLRFNAGESNILEQTSATTQRGQIALQLLQLGEDRSLLELQFQLLLNSNEPLIPAGDHFKMDPVLQPDSGTVLLHPYIRDLEQQMRAANAGIRLEKARLLPEITLQYNNMSMQGTGADDIRYNAGTRFQSGQLGIGIPLFFGPQKARIEAARHNEAIAAGNLAMGRQQMQQEYQAAWIQYRKNLEALRYYEQTALPNARKITNTLNLQLSKGEINYLEWTLLNSQAVSVMSAYLDTVKSLNESIIQLNYMMSR